MFATRQLPGPGCSDALPATRSQGATALQPGTARKLIAVVAAVGVSALAVGADFDTVVGATAIAGTVPRVFVGSFVTKPIRQHLGDSCWQCLY